MMSKTAKAELTHQDYTPYRYVTMHKKFHRIGENEKEKLERQRERERERDREKEKEREKERERDLEYYNVYTYMLICL